jgi:vancomycin resistance protein YoaR
LIKKSKIQRYITYSKLENKIPKTLQNIVKKDIGKMHSSEYMSFLLTQDKKAKNLEIAADAFNISFSQ